MFSWLYYHHCINYHSLPNSSKHKWIRVGDSNLTMLHYYVFNWKHNFQCQTFFFIPSGGSGWIIGLGLVCWVFHPLLCGVVTPGDSGFELQLGCWDISFPACCVSFPMHSSYSLPLFLCLISFLCCSHVLVFGRTLLHDLHIPYIHAECSLFTQWELW